MASNLVDSDEMQRLIDKIGGIGEASGDARKKKILRRIVTDLFSTIDEFDVTPDEFWSALNFLAEGAPELGLWAAGLGFERFLDIRQDLIEARAGADSGTPRTIEGPLYVAGAPLSKGMAQLDDGSTTGNVLVMHGQVLDTHKQPIADAIVDVWQANEMGNYSYFDKTQPAYNLRRRIQTGTDGRYKFRSIMPCGYAVPAGGTTERLLQAVGRHGRRPAHIHFFVSAPDHRHLTTQINISSDPLLHDDFAYATRAELIPDAVVRNEPAAIRAEGLQAPFTEIVFNFVLARSQSRRDSEASSRLRVQAF